MPAHAQIRSIGIAAPDEIEFLAKKIVCPLGTLELPCRSGGFVTPARGINPANSVPGFRLPVYDFIILLEEVDVP